MSDPVKAFMQAFSLESPAFPPSSRYHGLATAVWTRPDGRDVAYVLRRFVPAADKLATLQEYVMNEADRLDNIAARHLGDPEQFWRLCDANEAMRPDSLEVVGKRIRITLPEGIPGGEDQGA